MKARLLLTCVVGILALAIVGQVSAHSNPIRFDPAPGIILDAAPNEVRGWFSSDLRRDDDSFIKVLDEGGQSVDAGEVQLGTDRREMAVALQSGLGPGRYLVYWGSSDDADGEVTGGCFTFFVGQAAADAAIAEGVSLDGGGDCPAGGHDDAAAPESDASLDIEVEVAGSDARLTMLPQNFAPRAPSGSGQDPNNGHYHIYLDKVPVDIIASASHHEEGEEGEASGEQEGSEMEDMNDKETSEEESSELEGGLGENPQMWFENAYEFKDLSPGKHTVAVALMYDDHTPFQPPTIASETFTVSGVSGGDGGSDIPAWLLLVTGGIGLAVGVVGARLTVGRSNS